MRGRRTVSRPTLIDTQRTKIETAAAIWLRLAPYFDESPRVCRDMFATLIEHAPTEPTTSQLPHSISRQTLVSRFHRAGLPSMKQYHDRLRLLYALAYLEQLPAATVESAALDLGYSSGQAFCRSVKRMTGGTVRELTSRKTFAQALADFAAQMIEPHTAKLRRFLPLAKVA